MTRKDVATLPEIANWQLESAIPGHLNVDLPKLQRGFVWKPAKVINLWDSLLRGFPIGSLLLSEISDEGTSTGPDSYWLLDGQQRATSIAMGFYNPWTEPGEKEGWSLKKIPVLWIDIGPLKIPAGEEKLFFPFLTTQSHPWGYALDGQVLPWGHRQKALELFHVAEKHDDYTRFPLKSVFPFAAKLPVPLAFMFSSTAQDATDRDQFKAALVEQCQMLPEIWKNKFDEGLKQLDSKCLAPFHEAMKTLKDCRVHLNYLDLRARGNDHINKDDNSILFVRLNTGGEMLRGEELMFSLFKSAFPKAKDAVETAAASFMPASQLFALLVRVISAGEDSSDLHNPISLRGFRDMIVNSTFKKQLEAFINDGCVAHLVGRAKSLLTGNDSFGLPQALATRTVAHAPEVFLALLHWLNRRGDVTDGSSEHRSLLATITALAWFTPGDAKHKRENLRQWMEAIKEHPISEFWNPVREFWNPENIRVLFTQKERPIPGLPAPADLRDFLEHANIVNLNENDCLKEQCAGHKIFRGYSSAALAQENVRSFLLVLRNSKTLLMFAQREFLAREFKEYQQWNLILDDTSSPWDWDHIYPSAKGKWYVDLKYREWHNTIGNLRAEKLSTNRKDGAASPRDKLHDVNVRKNSFVSENVWKMIQEAGTDYKNEAMSNIMRRIFLARMADIYAEWYNTLGIGQLMEGIFPANLSRSGPPPTDPEAASGYREE